MEFICNTTDFNNHLSLVGSAVPSRPTHPILGNILVVADAAKGKVSLTGFDLTLGICTSFPAQVITGGSMAMPAKLLKDIVARLPQGEIEIKDTEEDNPLVMLSSVSGRFQIRAMSATEYPALPLAGEIEPLYLPIGALTEGIKGALFAASTDETKQILTGVHLKASGNEQEKILEFAATDGHRLAVVQTIVSSPEDRPLSWSEFAITIPARALRELERILSNAQPSDRIALYVDESQIVFELGEQRLTSRKLEGAYPAYDKLIPKEFSRKATVERKRLLSSLELVAVLTDQKNNVVKFSLDNDGSQLSLLVNSQDLGDARESMPAEVTGLDVEIGFNVKYLMDGLKAFTCKDIKMELNEWNQPVIFTPHGGINMTYLVMPVQIKI